MTQHDKAVEFVSKFYDVSHEDAIELYQDEIECYIRLMELNDHADHPRTEDMGNTER